MSEEPKTKKQRVVEKCQKCEESDDKITLLFVCTDNISRGFVVEGISKRQMEWFDYLLYKIDYDYPDFTRYHFYIIDLFDPNLTLEDLQEVKMDAIDGLEDVRWLDKLSEYMGGFENLNNVFLADEAQPVSYKEVEGFDDLNALKLKNVTVRFTYYFDR